MSGGETADRELKTRRMLQKALDDCAPRVMGLVDPSQPTHSFCAEVMN